MYRAKRHGLGSLRLSRRGACEPASSGTAGARIAAAPPDPLRIGAGRARAPTRAAARGERAAGAGRAQRPGTAGCRGAGAPAAGGIHGGGGARAAQPADADPHWRRQLLGRFRADEPLLRRVQAIIERQVEHISRLVGDLLDVSRASTGKLRLERQVVEMAVIIDQAVNACRPAMDTRLQHFGVRVPSCPLEVHGDPVRLAQILSNLLDNASKYTPGRRRDRAFGGGGRRCHRDDRVRQRHRDRSRGLAQCVRAVHAGHTRRWLQRRWPGHRAARWCANWSKRMAATLSRAAPVADSAVSSSSRFL